MECMQFLINPLPQLVTLNHSQRSAGWKYTRRSYNAYELIFCCNGDIHIAEEGKEYTVRPGQMLVLDPAKEHWGHQKAEQDIEFFYVYFLHTPVIRQLENKKINWKTHIPGSKKRDPYPPEEQYMFIPKFAEIDLAPVLPILNDMLMCHRALCLENSLKLQALLIQLLQLLQAAVRSHDTSRSFVISEAVKHYLQKNYTEPIQAADLENHFHFHFDYLVRCMKRHVGMSPLHYLRYLRMNEAKQLLLNSDLTLADIAERIGVKDYNYFSRIFRQSFGVAPGKYRTHMKSGTSQL